MIASAAAALAVVVVMAPWLLDLRRPVRRPDVQQGERREFRSSVSRRAAGVVRRVARLGQQPDQTSSWIDALDRLARATATGSSMAQAIATEEARADSPEPLRQLARLRAGGLSLTEAIMLLPPAEDPDARLSLSVLGVIARAGGAPAEPLDRAAAVLRERRSLSREREVGAAQSRLSAQVLSFLPAGAGVWSIMTDPKLRLVLLGTPVGLLCLVVGAALDIVGWRWMRRIVGRA